MKFILKDELKVGMRLGKPIYNRDGTLLYKTGSRLTAQGINSVFNFGIIGLYILEEPEPVPFMSAEDEELERFQVAATIKLNHDWRMLIKDKPPKFLNSLVEEIISKYGNLDHKINYSQTIRSDGDKFLKRCLSTAILSAMICHQMNRKSSEMENCVTSGLLLDIGSRHIPPRLLKKSDEELDDHEIDLLYANEIKGKNSLEAGTNKMPLASETIEQFLKLRRMRRHGKLESEAVQFTDAARILMTASEFDRLTSVGINKEPVSMLSALRAMQKNTDFFEKATVKALINSINVLASGCSVVLTNGLKGCVIKDNRFNVSRPTVLIYEDNSIVDLSDMKKYRNVDVKDVLKSLDNRWIIDRKLMDEYLRQG